MIPHKFIHIFLDGFFFVKVQSICVIFSKSLSRHQRYQREAAAAALSEFICYRYVYNVNQHSLLVTSFHYFTYFQRVKNVAIFMICYCYHGSCCKHCVQLSFLCHLSRILVIFPFTFAITFICTVLSANYV